MNKQSELIAKQNKKISSQNDTIAKQNEKILILNEAISMQNGFLKRDKLSHKESFDKFYS